jgi:hypothetical protein
VLNAYTSREQTAFHARILKQDVPLALDMIGDILSNPTFEQAELERERQVVLQELGQARDTPDDIVFDHLQLAIFQDQPLGWPILGEEATVRLQPRDAEILYGVTIPAGGALIASGAEPCRHPGAGEKCAGLNWALCRWSCRHTMSVEISAPPKIWNRHGYAFPGRPT